MSNLPEKKGRTLGGVLALGIIIGVVVSLAFPRRARRSTLEGNTAGSMRAYAEAQVMFHRNDWQGSGTPGVLEYAHPFPLLYYQKDENGDPINLIDSAFAGAVPGGPGADGQHREHK